MGVPIVAWVVVISLRLSSLAAVAAAAPPDWYASLQHFGPLRTSGWAARPMVLDPATGNFSLAGLDAVAGDELMFVSLTDPGQPPPPLGPLNWKQGKIGIGRVLAGLWDRQGRDTLDRPAAEGRWQRGVLELVPGGGAGRYPGSGIFSLTVDVASMRLTWDAVLSGPAAWIGFESPVEVSADPERRVLVRFTEPVALQSGWLSLENAELSSAGVTDASGGRAVAFTFSVTAVQRGRAAEVTVRAGGAVALAADAAPGSASRTVSFLCVEPSRLLTGASWGPLMTLRDTSGVARGDAPDGGWFVTPIHANYIPSLRKVLFSGWLRRDGLPCAGGPGGPGGRRRSGVTFLMDPLESLAAVPPPSTEISIDRIDEADLFPMETAADRHPPFVQDGQVVDGDVIYCAGHTPLAERAGRVFIVGGARYAGISSPREWEWGLDYARIFDPSTQRITRVSTPMPLGASWYPTAGRLPDGRILVTGAFTAYATDKCVGDTCLNSQINIFDPNAGSGDPWTVLLDSAHADDDIAPGIREYTRVFPLPVPVVDARDDDDGTGIQRDVLLLGKRGRVILAAVGNNSRSSDASAVPQARRLIRARNGTRPGGCVESSDQSTAVTVAQRGGEIVIMGGCVSDRETLQRIDVYNVISGQWRSFDTGVRRGVPASTWLPDGTVLILSGEDPTVDQIAAANVQASQITARSATVFDPETGEVFAETAAGSVLDVFRGYHNTLALLHDGSVVVGGGFEIHGDVGCENPNARLYRPSYLSRGPRPAILGVSKPEEVAEQTRTRTRTRTRTQRQAVPPLMDDPAPQGSVAMVTLWPNTRAVFIEFQGAALHGTRPVSLVAVQALTHSYGQNGRYIPLPVRSRNETHIEVDIPDERHALPGHYHLFLISDKGVPSISVHAWVAQPGDPPLPSSSPAPSKHDEGGGGGKQGTKHTLIIAGVVASAVALVALVGAIIARMSSSAGTRMRSGSDPTKLVRLVVIENQK
jgi:hypothetical protein